MKKHCLLLKALCAVMVFVSCTQPQPLPNLNTDNIAKKERTCQESFNRLVSIWAGWNPEELRGIFTDDVVYFNGYPEFRGIDHLIRNAENLLIYFGEWNMEAGDTFISGEECVGSWKNWGMADFTHENPGVEYVQLETHDGKISLWRSYYDPNFWRLFHHPERINQQLINQFGSFWTHEKANRISNMYSSEAVVEDTLFDLKATGHQEIAQYFRQFQTKSERSPWILVTPLSEDIAPNSYKDQYPFATQGGVFRVQVKDNLGQPCEIHVLALIEPNEFGKITHQKILYNARTLQECGWTE